MNYQQKTILATYMNYPTKLLAGRITEGLAKETYNTFEELINVVGKIESETLKLDNYGVYHANVQICTGYVSIEFSRQRKESGFKDGVFDSFQVSIQLGSDKLKNIQLAIIDFLKWKKED